MTNLQLLRGETMWRDKSWVGPTLFIRMNIQSPQVLFIFLEFWSPHLSILNLIGCVEPCMSTQFRVLLIGWKSKLITFYLDYVVVCDGSRLVCFEGLPRNFIFRTHHDFSSYQCWKGSKWSYICNTLFVKSIKTKIIIKALFHLLILCLWVLLYSHCIFLLWKWNETWMQRQWN